MTMSPGAKPHFRINFLMESAKECDYAIALTHNVSPPRIALGSSAPAALGLMLPILLAPFAQHVGRKWLRSVGWRGSIPVGEPPFAAAGFGTESGLSFRCAALFSFHGLYVLFLIAKLLDPAAKRPQGQLFQIFQNRRRNIGFHFKRMRQASCLNDETVFSECSAEPRTPAGGSQDS
jgi:hypothetical protein